ncbi:hypothetical protein [Alteromonas gracilis]|uniref:hypothetical protein n=1 Tax=Alteromonas gracilis TaxID=1479524 RepID=UPI00373684F9
MSKVVTVFFYLLLISISNIVFAQTADQCEVEHCVAQKPTVVWLRPPGLDIESNGVTITSGPMYDLMAYLSGFLDNYHHQFETYPVKRAWSLIKNHHSSEQVYCFYGASFKEKRTEWGYFSQPTSTNLPLIIVSKRNLQPFANNNDAQIAKGHFTSISLQNLFAHGFKTVLYNDVNNAYADAVEQWASDKNIVRLNSLDKDLGIHTIALLKNGRIDFGYVGHRELSALSEEELDSLYVYQVSELSQKVRGTKRLLCSKSELGQAVTKDLNGALERAFSEPQLSQTLREINFSSDAYPVLLKPLFDERWKTYMSSRKQGYYVLP